MSQTSWNRRPTLARRRRRGQGYYEYTLLLTIIGLGLYITTEGLGLTIDSFYNDTSDTIADAAAGAGGEPEDP